MKDKFKTRLNEVIRDPFAQGIVLGGVIGTTTTIILAKHFNVSFSPETRLHVPDHLVEHILTTGLPIMTTRPDGVQLMIGPS